MKKKQIKEYYEFSVNVKDITIYEPVTVEATLSPITLYRKEVVSAKIAKPK
jgi:hypothetical protein